MPIGYSCPASLVSEWQGGSSLEAFFKSRPSESLLAEVSPRYFSTISAEIRFNDPLARNAAHGGIHRMVVWAN